MKNKGLIGFLRNPFTSIWAITFGEGDVMAEHGPGKLFLAILFFPIILLFQFLFFLFLIWTVSRESKRFIFGLPAFVIFAGFVGGIGIFQIFQQNVENRYLGSYFKAVNAEDYELASLWTKKILSLDPDNSDYKFYAASLRSRQGDNESTLPMMQDLAHLDGEEIGNLDAHYWCAVYFLKPEKKGEEVAPEKISLATKHLLRIVEGLKSEENQIRLQFDENGNPVDPAMLSLSLQTYAMLGSIYEKQERFEDALENYLSAAGYLPTFYPKVLALLEKSEPLGKDSRKFATIQKIAIQQTKAKVLQTQNVDRFELWQTLVQCHIASDDYEAANKQIESARRLVTRAVTRRRLSRLRSDVYVHAVDNFDYRGTDEAKFKERIRLITTALRFLPGNPNAVAKLVEIIEPPNGPLTDEQIEWLRDMTITEETTFVANIILGLDAAIRSLTSANPSDKSEAIVQWKTAINQNPATNNIINIAAALIGTKNKNENIDMAIRLLDFAIDMKPEETMFLESRGVMLYRKERYRDAYDDLHTAYETNGNRIGVVKSLIACVEKLIEASPDDNQLKDELANYQARLEMLETRDKKARQVRNKS